VLDELEQAGVKLLVDVATTGIAIGNGSPKSSLGTPKV
jgi:hypothetical protein